MNSLNKRLPLPVILLIVGLVPLLFLLYFAIQIYQEKTEKIRVLGSFIEQVNRSTEISSLINELQLERRHSFNFTVKGQDESRMLLQRSKVDSVLKALHLPEGQDLARFKDYTVLTELIKVREQIDQKRIYAPEVMSFYTNAIFRLNTQMTAPELSYLKPVQGDLVGQKILSEMITYFGILRANIYYALYSGQEPTTAADQIKGLYEIFHSYELELKYKGSPEAVREYERITRNPEMSMILGYLHTSLAKGELQYYNTDLWWERTGTAIDQVKRVQGNL